jgi:AraC-like DNA-binding protein
MACALSMMLAGHLWLSRAPGRSLMAAFCAIFGLQAGLLLVQLLDPTLLPAGLRPTIAAVIPPLLYLFFARGASRHARALTGRDALHALPALWILTLSGLSGWGVVIDLSLLVFEIGYALALLSVDRAGRAGAIPRRGALLASAAFLLTVAAVDVAISVELEAGASLAASWGLRIGMGLMLAATLALFVWAWRDPEWFRRVSDRLDEVERVTPTSAPPSEVDRNAQAMLCQRLDLLLADTDVCSEFGLSLAAVAKRLAVSPRQLSDAVNLVHARGFRTLLNDRKVAEAARLLADPVMAGRTITDIMFDAGFQTKSSFNKEFAARTGMTPSEFRRCRVP